MITVLIACNQISAIEKISGSILRGSETTTCLLSSTNAQEALKIIDNKNYRIDMFVIEVQLQDMGGHKLEEAIRAKKAYQETPILFITKGSYNLVGFSHLATYESSKKHNYISLPIDNIDVQGKIGLYLEKILANQLKYDRANRIITLNHARGTAKVPAKSILFMEIQNKQCTLHTTEGDYLVKRKSLSEMLSLFDSESLVKSHKCFALNADQITAVERVDKRNWAARFKNSDCTCPISKTYIAEVLARYSPESEKNV